MPAARQAQKRLVYESRRVEPPCLALTPQMSRREFLQFLVDERNDNVQGLRIAGMNTLQ